MPGHAPKIPREEKKGLIRRKRRTFPKAMPYDTLEAGAERSRAFRRGENPYIRRQPVPEEQEMVQPKLEVLAPEDEKEKEAEQAEEQIVQRQVAETTATEADEGSESGIQRKESKPEIQAQSEGPDINPKELKAKPKVNPIRTKLEIGAPDDQYEKEADDTADKVMRMKEPIFADGGEGIDGEDENNDTPGIQMKLAGGLIQREAENEEEEGLLMRKGEGGKLETTPKFNSTLSSTKGNGSALPDRTRSFMEGRLGNDFGGVRVHTGTNADKLARGINSRAFTHGSDIYFKNGEYSPDSDGGKKLLAHELTHTVQQGGGVKTKVMRQEEGEKSEEDDRKELKSNERLRFLLHKDTLEFHGGKYELKLILHEYNAGFSELNETLRKDFLYRDFLLDDSVYSLELRISVLDKPRNAFMVRPKHLEFWYELPEGTAYRDLAINGKVAALPQQSQHFHEMIEAAEKNQVPNEVFGEVIKGKKDIRSLGFQDFGYTHKENPYVTRHAEVFEYFLKFPQSGALPLFLTFYLEQDELNLSTHRFQARIGDHQMTPVQPEGTEYSYAEYIQDAGDHTRFFVRGIEVPEVSISDERPERSSIKDPQVLATMDLQMLGHLGRAVLQFHAKSHLRRGGKDLISEYTDPKRGKEHENIMAAIGFASRTIKKSRKLAKGLGKTAKGHKGGFRDLEKLDDLNFWLSRANNYILELNNFSLPGFSTKDPKLAAAAFDIHLRSFILAYEIFQAGILGYDSPASAGAKLKSAAEEMHRLKMRTALVRQGRMELALMEADEVWEDIKEIQGARTTFSNENNRRLRIYDYLRITEDESFVNPAGFMQKRLRENEAEIMFQSKGIYEETTAKQNQLNIQLALSMMVFIREQLAMIGDQVRGKLGVAIRSSWFEGSRDPGTRNSFWATKMTQMLLKAENAYDTHSNKFDIGKVLPILQEFQKITTGEIKRADRYGVYKDQSFTMQEDIEYIIHEAEWGLWLHGFLQQVAILIGALIVALATEGTGLPAYLEGVGVAGAQFGSRVLAFTSGQWGATWVVTGEFPESNFFGDLLLNAAMFKFVGGAQQFYAEVAQPLKALSKGRLYTAGGVAVEGISLHAFTELHHLFLTGEFMEQSDRVKSMLNVVLLIPAMRLMSVVGEDAYLKVQRILGSKAAERIYQVEPEAIKELYELKKDFKSTYENMLRGKWHGADFNGESGFLEMERIFNKETQLFERLKSRAKTDPSLSRLDVSRLSEYNKALATNMRIEIARATGKADYVSGISFRPISGDVTAVNRGGLKLLEAHFNALFKADQKAALKSGKVKVNLNKKLGILKVETFGKVHTFVSEASMAKKGAITSFTKGGDYSPAALSGFEKTLSKTARQGLEKLKGEETDPEIILKELEILDSIHPDIEVFLESLVRGEEPFQLTRKNVFAFEENFVVRLNEDMTLTVNLAKIKDAPREVLLEEYAHVWLQLAERIDPGIIDGIFDQVRTSEPYKRIAKNPFYWNTARKSQDPTRYLVKETLAQAVRNGGKDFPSREKGNFIREFLERMWNAVVEGLIKLGVRLPEGKKDLRGMKAGELVETIYAEVTSGKPIASEGSVELAEFITGERRDINLQNTLLKGIKPKGEVVPEPFYSAEESQVPGEETGFVESAEYYAAKKSDSQPQKPPQSMEEALSRCIAEEKSYQDVISRVVEDFNNKGRKGAYNVRLRKILSLLNDQKIDLAVKKSKVGDLIGELEIVFGKNDLLFQAKQALSELDLQPILLRSSNGMIPLEGGAISPQELFDWVKTQKQLPGLKGENIVLMQRRFGEFVEYRIVIDEFYRKVNLRTSLRSRGFTEVTSELLEHASMSLVGRSGENYKVLHSNRFPGEQYPNCPGKYRNITYYYAESRLKHEVFVNKDKKLCDRQGKVLDTPTASGGQNRFLVVMGRMGEIFIGPQQAHKIHHSSYLAGEPAAFAGEIVIKSGEIVYLNRESGHYLPTKEGIEQFLSELRRRGLSKNELSFHIKYSVN